MAACSAAQRCSKAPNGWVGPAAVALPPTRRLPLAVVRSGWPCCAALRFTARPLLPSTEAVLRLGRSSCPSCLLRHAEAAPKKLSPSPATGQPRPRRGPAVSGWAACLQMALCLVQVVLLASETVSRHRPSLTPALEAEKARLEAELAAAAAAAQRVKEVSTGGRAPLQHPFSAGDCTHAAPCLQDHAYEMRRLFSEVRVLCSALHSAALSRVPLHGPARPPAHVHQHRPAAGGGGGAADGRDAGGASARSRGPSEPAVRARAGRGGGGGARDRGGREKGVVRGAPRWVGNRTPGRGRSRGQGRLRAALLCPRIRQARRGAPAPTCTAAGDPGRAGEAAGGGCAHGARRAAALARPRPAGGATGAAPLHLCSLISPVLPCTPMMRTSSLAASLPRLPPRRRSASSASFAAWFRASW